MTSGQRMKLAKLLFEWRAQLDLTMSQAAATVHAAERTWRRWENGERDMDPARLHLFLLLHRAHLKLDRNACTKLLKEYT